MDPKESFLEFFKKFSLFFWKKRKTNMRKTHIWENLFLKLQNKMWSSNNITGLFDHQYFWEVYVIFDYFRCRYSPSKGSLSDYSFWLCLSRYSQPHPNLAGLYTRDVGWTRNMNKLNISNEISNNFLKNVFFKKHCFNN